MTIIEAGGGGLAGVASGAPYVVALATCYQAHSAESGVSNQVRIVVDAYNLSPSADGSTLTGLPGSQVASPNTTFYAYPDGSTDTGSSAVGMGIANGEGWGETGVDDSGGPDGYNVIVL